MRRARERLSIRPSIPADDISKITTRPWEGYYDPRKGRRAQSGLAALAIRTTSSPSMAEARDASSSPSGPAEIGGVTLAHPAVSGFLAYLPDPVPSRCRRPSAWSRSAPARESTRAGVRYRGWLDSACSPSHYVPADPALQGPACRQAMRSADWPRSFYPNHAFGPGQRLDGRYLSKLGGRARRHDLWHP